MSRQLEEKMNSLIPMVVEQSRRRQTVIFTQGY